MHLQPEIAINEKINLVLAMKMGALEKEKELRLIKNRIKVVPFPTKKEIPSTISVTSDLI